MSGIHRLKNLNLLFQVTLKKQNTVVDRKCAKDTSSKNHFHSACFLLLKRTFSQTNDNKTNMIGGRSKADHPALGTGLACQNLEGIHGTYLLRNLKLSCFVQLSRRHLYAQTWTSRTGSKPWLIFGKWSMQCYVKTHRSSRCP